MKKYRLLLIVLSVLILLGCIGITAYLLFSNYQNVRLFKQAQSNFLRGDDASLDLAEAQLLQLIRKDSENEAAFVMLSEIARRRKVYSEQVYYCFMAYRLNPLSSTNKEKYIDSLCFARYFDRLETFLSQEAVLNDKHKALLLYAAGHNGSIHKYLQQHPLQDSGNGIGKLTWLLFADPAQNREQKIAAFEKISSNGDAFLQQELFAAGTSLYLAQQDIERAEKCLLQAYELNQYAFAPVLARFYAHYRSLGQAVEIFEKYLSFYHDPVVAIQAAEIYFLLNRLDKIAELRTQYQADNGSRAMFCCYYLDALTALGSKNMAALQELTMPLRKNINTPVAAFMFFCADIQSSDLAAIQTSYNALLAHPTYLNLQEQADDILSNHLKNTFARNQVMGEQLISAAKELYKRKPEIFTAKLMLLAQKKSNSVNIVLLKDALKRFGNDQGIIKIAIEYYLSNEPAEAEKLIARYKQQFPAKSGDMLYYELNLNLQKKDYNKVSELFQKNFKPGILAEYWTFASHTMREKDLRFLAQNKLYEPFCNALLALKKGQKEQACALLENADAQNNPALIFFAAKTLAENGRHQAALNKYSQIPPGTTYQTIVWLNMAELHAENGELDQALLLSGRAYNTAPHMPETQLCYADKLYKKGHLTAIPDIIKLSGNNAYRRRMEVLWVAGMVQRIKECNINTQQEKIRELCRQLLVISPDNNTALDYLKKLRKMPQ